MDRVQLMCCAALLIQAGFGIQFLLSVCPRDRCCDPSHHCVGDSGQLLFSGQPCVALYITNVTKVYSGFLHMVLDVKLPDS